MNFRENINNLQNAVVVDQDGDKIGNVGQVYVHNGTQDPSWVTVNTGFFGTNETFIPLDDATYTDGEIRVPYEKSFVKDAPNIADDGEIDRAQEDELYRYYGVKDDFAAAGTAGTAGTTEDKSFFSEGHSADDRLAHDDARRTDADRRDVNRAGNDETVTLHEERVDVGTERVETGKLRLRKHVVTDTETVEVPVEREEVVVERTPADGRVAHGERLSDDEVEVSLTEERPVINKETVATEDVHVGTRTVQDTERVTTDVSREEVEVDNVDGREVRDADRADRKDKDGLL